MEKNNVAGIIIFFVGIIIATAFIPSIFGEQSTMTDTTYIGNSTFTLPATGSKSDLTPCGQGVVSITITNKTDGEVVLSSNYTTSQGVSSSTGVLTAQITALAGLYDGQSVNVSCIYKPFGYIEDSGGRSMADLVGIFSCIALMIFGVYMFAKDNEWLMGLVGR